MTIDRPRQQQAKRHRCAIPGCGKAFTRLSHLQRHALNHSDTQWVCSRCNAPFKRLDLLERHRARHMVKDSLAGGAGLGILQTRRRHVAGKHVLDQGSSPLRSRIIIDESQQVHPAAHLPPTGDIQDLTVGNGVCETSTQAPGPAITADILSPPMDLGELGNMYYDPAFDLEHFDVMGFMCSPPQVLSGTTPTSNGSTPYQATDDPQQPSMMSCSPRSMRWAETAPNRPRTIEEREVQRATMQHSMSSSPLGTDSTCIETLIHDVVEQTSDSDKEPDSLSHAGSNIELTTQKRLEILRLITDIHPVTPDGTIVDGNMTSLTMAHMQEYLNLFFRYFNTSYPMVHAATMQVANADPIFLLSMMILGATYKNKKSHQLSVCLYDALVPYILSGLMSIPIPDLSTLQAFLILECYGMYRAGPYQRENAMLIHTLLFSAIRRVSRYHVRAGITIPNHLTKHDGQWEGFAYAEQYKRLVLFVFMWDCQNVSCYSVMPNMSTHSIQVPLPCAHEVWAASTESAWEQASKTHPEPPSFKDTAIHLVEDGDRLQSIPMDRLSLTLMLHGLMSMCNDIAHFDNRSIYLSDLDTGEVSWTPWRRRMTHALETWKAKYDAYAIAAFQSSGDSSGAASDQEEEVALLALYHTAHIVINSEIRHLQAAAGAKAIFGHIVMPDDRQESAKWVKQWIKGQTAAADHAAWHAAQMLREGLLNLKSWDVNGVFHYPWCLVIATLTCWAFHRYGSEASDDGEEERMRCKHAGGTEMSQSQSRALMNHMVSLMASVSPTSIRRTLGKCCTHGLAIEVARFLKTVRWTAAFEAMKLLEGLSTTT